MDNRLTIRAPIRNVMKQERIYILEQERLGKADEEGRSKLNYRNYYQEEEREECLAICRQPGYRQEACLP